MYIVVQNMKFIWAFHVFLSLTIIFDREMRSKVLKEPLLLFLTKGAKNVREQNVFQIEIFFLQRHGLLWHLYCLL